MRGYEELASLRRSAEERRLELKVEIRGREASLAKARADLAEAERTKTRLTREMRSAKAVLASATGLDEGDLPFGAELMDVLEGCEEWRLAANVGFSELASTIFVQSMAEGELRRRVFGTPAEAIGRRQRFRFFDPDERPACPQPPREGYLSSKLRFDERSPASSELARLCSLAENDWRCADDASSFAEGEERQISPSAQAAQGRAGAHGVPPTRPDFIGFADKDYLERLAGAAEEAESRLAATREEEREAADEVAHLEAEAVLSREAYKTGWEEIDHWTTSHKLAMAKASLDKLKEGEGLAKVKESLDEACKRSENLAVRLAAAKSARDDRDSEIPPLEEWLSEVEGEAVQRDDLMDVSGPISDVLEVIWKNQVATVTRDGMTEDKNEYGTRLGLVIEDLSDHGKRLRSASEAQARQLSSQLVRFREEHGTRCADELRGLGTEARDAPGYLAIPREEDWESALASNQAEAIRRLLGLLMDWARSEKSYETEVRSTIQKINSILSTYKFDGEGGSIWIAPRFREDASYAELKRLANELLRDHFRETGAE